MHRSTPIVQRQVRAYKRRRANHLSAQSKAAWFHSVSASAPTSCRRQSDKDRDIVVLWARLEPCKFVASLDRRNIKARLSEGNVVNLVACGDFGERAVGSLLRQVLSKQRPT